MFMIPVKRFSSTVILLVSPVLSAAQKISARGGSPEHLADVEITISILKSAELRAPAVEQFRVPTGFRIQKFAENVGNARILAVGPEGSLSVTRREQSDVLMFKVSPKRLAAGSPVKSALRNE